MKTGTVQPIFPAAVSVEAPGRLHMGFLDIDSGSGRRFGSVGLALEGIFTRVVARRGSDAIDAGEETARIARYLAVLRKQYALPADVAIRLEQAIPGHVGLGSGTQLALAVGIAATRLAGIEAGAREIAGLLDRGGRSGIGIGAFEQGGFLIDGGRGPSDAPPPITVRAQFPEAWRVLLIFDAGGRGLHGEAEREAFGKLPQFPEADAARLCHLMLMHALPALAEGDLDSFGHAVTELQRTVGDHFAPAQGGRYASRRVSEVLEWLEAQGVACFGQSSWGPTGFAVLESEARAQAVAQAAAGRWGQGSQLSFVVCRGRNRGGSVQVAADAALHEKRAAGA